MARDEDDLQADMVMKCIGKNMRAVFFMCIQGVVITALMLLRMPSGVADGSATPDVPLKSEQISVSTPSHMASHTKITNDQSIHIGKSGKMPKADNVDDKSMKKHVSLPLPSDNHGESIPKVVQPIIKAFDMHVLIERLKKTDAIGMFTKLALRSDALDLTDMVNAYHKHMAGYTLKELHARFNGLLLKVLALLDDDPGLARDISLAHENIWKSLLEVKA